MKPYADSFYRAIAERYEALWPESNRIAPVIAEEMDVPVMTARRWIGAARHRGFLGPPRPASERPPKHSCPACDHGAR